MLRPRRESLVLDERAFIKCEGRPTLRDFQLEEIKSCFSSESSRAKPINVWLHGPTGTGKTLCVRYLLENEARPCGVMPVYVNCRERFTFLAVVEAILDSVKPLRAAQRTREYQLSILQEVLKERKSVIALDEIDIIKQKDIADLLHRLCSLPSTSIICIAPTRQPLLSLPETIRSRLGPRQILFPRYEHEEVMAILAWTAEKGMRSGTWTRDVLEKIVNNSYGDCRRALSLLRHSIQRAEDSGDAQLKPEHIEVSNSNHTKPNLEDRFVPLSSHHRMLYDIAKSLGPIPGPDLEREYCKACREKTIEPVAPRTISKYLNMLCRRKLLDRQRGAGTSGWIYRAAETIGEDAAKARKSP